MAHLLLPGGYTGRVVLDVGAGILISGLGLVTFHLAVEKPIRSEALPVLLFEVLATTLGGAVLLRPLLGGETLVSDACNQRVTAARGRPFLTTWTMWVVDFWPRRNLPSTTTNKTGAARSIDTISRRPRPRTVTPCHLRWRRRDTHV